MSRAALCLGLLCGLAAGGSPSRRPAADFDVDLDKAPEQRYVEVIAHFKEPIQHFVEKFFTGVEGAAVKAVTWGLAEKRGEEKDPELAAEIEGIARLTGVPKYGIQALQMLYELNTLMVPIKNITLPWKGPGCTGIIALNKKDGMVYHGCNQDFSPAPLLQNLVYTGIFKKGGKEIFRAQMLAGFALPLTAMKKGPNGFTYEGNTRFPDKVGDDSEMLRNLLHEKRPLNAWSIRKAMEASEDYEAFVEALSTVKYVAPQYNVIGGVKKGTILARSPDRVVYRLVLGQSNPESRDDYIIVTNFDYWWHDVREWFDYTSMKGIGNTRRIPAQKLLNASDAITPEVLFSVIDDDEVRATDTIYQALMSVEAGVWNVSLPMCKECGGQEAQGRTLVV